MVSPNLIKFPCFFVDVLKKEKCLQERKLMLEKRLLVRDIDPSLDNKKLTKKYAEKLSF